MGTACCLIACQCPPTETMMVYVDSCNYEKVDAYLTARIKLADSAINQAKEYQEYIIDWRNKTVDSITAWKNSEYQKLQAWKDSIENLHVEMYDNMIIHSQGKAEAVFDSITGKPKLIIK